MRVPRWCLVGVHAHREPSHKQVYYFSGHGAKNQIADKAALQHNLDLVVQSLDEKEQVHGAKEGTPRNWVAFYGGDE